MTTTQETIRKAAIVIASLDEASADKLLESMPEDVASQIRWMSIELENISDDERQTVLDEFLRNSGRQLPVEDSGVDIEFTYEEPEAVSSVSAVSAPTPPPFAFLNDAPSEMLAPFFEQEHPQVTAVVMSYVSAERASEILRQLPPQLQADIVHRITQLDEPSQEIVAEIEARIKQIVSRQTIAFQRRQQGMAAAQAILKASSGDQAEQLLAELRSRGSQIPSDLETFKGHEPAVRIPFPVQPPTQVVQLPEAPAASPTSKHEAKREVEEKRVVPATAKPDSRTPNTIQPRFPFERFARLDDVSLAKVLHQAGPKVVLLALCGASPEVMKRISRGLGAGDVKLLERKIREMQPVLLSDIDHAKQQMCLAADTLLTSSQSTPSRSLQAAA
ncbi:FliG C-terminal domain-containing protein [Bremerella sp. T1]|uniref:FliG C-terminal domain-containing protein n=1 Tax=Bremerella sp. TYQ1 TaxID=3119568 RepID=UPI001CCB7CAA|nr:FliG C-terminal domain-containing protein [Bremerella volcania]UBM38198.1 hypothetical protein LA756_09930 [Bremerella volcania]